MRIFVTANSPLKKLTKSVSHKGGFLHMWQRDKTQEKNITLLYCPTEKKNQLLSYRKQSKNIYIFWSSAFLLMVTQFEICICWWLWGGVLLTVENQIPSTFRKYTTDIRKVNWYKRNNTKTRFPSFFFFNKFWNVSRSFANSPLQFISYRSMQPLNLVHDCYS